MKKNKKFAATAMGAVLFFLTVAAVVTVSVLVYGALIDGGYGKSAIAVIMLLVIILLALVGTIIDLVRRNLTTGRPVREILDATDRIASGDFSVRLEITHDYARYNEFDLIKENLNKMAAELAKTEVLHNDFISNVSHEIKTPLAVIQNYAVALQSGAIDEETRGKYAQTLVGASKRLTALVTNILKLNKLENQQLTPEYMPFKLDEAIAQAVLAYEDVIENKQLNLECDLDEVEITSCPDYLETVWNNLISNAVKFTDEGGTVRVSLKGGDGKAVVKVSDTGCGISKQTGEHIFEKFYQGDTSRSREGNGLGLALVKKVIDVLGGEISVESEPEKGSTFTVVIYEKK